MCINVHKCATDIVTKARRPGVLCESAVKPDTVAGAKDFINFETFHEALAASLQFAVRFSEFAHPYLL